MPLPKLILVTGPPAAGKTVMARRLANRLRLPLIAKDTIKESLFESLGYSDESLTKKLGGATFDLLYDLTAEQLRAGKSVIVEAAFWKDSSAETLRRILDSYPARPIEIHCTAATDILAARYVKREFSDDRHPGHRAAESADRNEFSAVIDSGRYDALHLTDELITIDTSYYDSADFGNIEQGPAELLGKAVGRLGAGTPHLVLVTGISGSGKTVLARRLANNLSLPLLAPDTLRERLYETLGWSDPDLHEAMGPACYELLYVLVEEQLRARKSLIVDAVFWKEPNDKTFTAILARYPATTTELHCTADPDTLFNRVLKRQESASWHPGHGLKHESERAEFIRTIRSGIFDPLELGKNTTIIDTSDFDQVNLDQIEQQLRERLM